MKIFCTPNDLCCQGIFNNKIKKAKQTAKQILLILIPFIIFSVLSLKNGKENIDFSKLFFLIYNLKMFIRY